MRSKRVSYLRGRRLRATIVDANGRPIYGDNGAVTTKGYVNVSYTTNVEEGESIILPNAGGETCIFEPATPTFNGFGVEAEFCEVDFALFEILTGQDVVLDAGGRAIGITESTDVNLTAVNFALEVWLGATTTEAAATGSQGQYGYVLTPFLGGGVIGDVTIENAAITFTVTGMATKNGSGWGAGPYPVELVGGLPAVLRVPMKANDHRRIMTVEVAPPAVYSGAIPVLDPSKPALTGLTTTNTGLSVAIAPTPAGTDPIFYDFGDGTFDYAATGSYTKVYAAAGTYTLTGRRGSSVFSKSVTVS
jgi:hypothetical protein